MKTKQLLMWGGVLLAVVAIIVVSERLSTMRPAEKSLRFFPAFSEDNCSKIVISKGMDTVCLVREGATYKLQLTAAPVAAPENLLGSAPSAPGVPKLVSADSAALQTAIDKLKSLKKDILSSNKIEKQSVFQVDSATGTRLEVFNGTGASMGVVYIGKNGPDYSTNFVRAFGSSDIYTVGGNPGYAFFTDKSRWRDKSIVKFDRSLPVKITMTKKSGDVIVLAKSVDSATAGTWNMVAPQAAVAKADVVNNLLSALSAFNTTEWEESAIPLDSLGFNAPELRMVIELKGGATRELIVGNKNVPRNQFFVKTPDKGEIFRVDAYTIQGIDKSATDFLEGAAEAAPLQQPIQMPMPMQFNGRK